VGRLAQKLEGLDRAEARALLEGLDRDAYGALVLELFDWEGTWARKDQCEPGVDWRKWFIKGGRGSGKTRAGAELVRKKVETGAAQRIALVGRTASDVRDTMIEGESGILAVSSPWNYPAYNPSLRRLQWKGSQVVSGAHYTGRSYRKGPRAVVFTSKEPDLLRGPQHDFAWADEIASWFYPRETWDNLMLGLRLGTNPQAVITSTPKPIKLVRDLVREAGVVVTNPSTFDNIPNLAPAFVEEVVAKYAGTQKGRQELYGELLEESEGALWRRSWIERDRVNLRDVPPLEKVVVAVDPAVTSGEDSAETGIVGIGSAQVVEVAGGGRPQRHLYTLRDVSGRYSPDGWARRAVELHDELEADEIVAEANNGGEMVAHTIRTVPRPTGRPVVVILVHASRGKRPRAEPVAALAEQGRDHHVRERRESRYDDAAGEVRPVVVPNAMDELEDQLCNWEPGGESPDRLDAKVWGASRLLEKTAHTSPRLGRLLGGSDRASAWRSR